MSSGNAITLLVLGGTMFARTRTYELPSAVISLYRDSTYDR